MFYGVSPDNSHAGVFGWRTFFELRTISGRTVKGGRLPLRANRPRGPAEAAGFRRKSFPMDMGKGADGMNRRREDDLIQLARLYGIAETLHPLRRRSNGDIAALIRRYARQYARSGEADLSAWFARAIEVERLDDS